MAIPPPQRETAAVAIRDLHPGDFPAVVEILNLLYPEHPTTVEEERFEEERFDRTKYVWRRYVAVDSSDMAIGVAEFSHMTTAFDPRRFWMWIGVHPRWQRQGVGSALYAHLAEQLRAMDALALRSGARETMADAQRWLERRGFRELSRHWESRLDLPSFDVSKFADHWPIPQGIDVVTLAEELGRNPESIRTLFELDCDISPDEPRVDPYTKPDFQMYVDRTLKSPGANPGSVFIAKEGDRYVGLSELFRDTAIPGTLTTGFTGVRRELRGRGIAFALKLRALDWAKRNGYREVRTWNSTLNAPMLGINVKLGFARQPAWIQYGKDLTEA